MGVELHITRAEFWAENSDQFISSEEWIDLVNSDPELEILRKNGEFFAIWKGESEYDEPWLQWFEGNISTKWPDTALYNKMLEIASKLNAHVQDDDGTNYPEDAQWKFSPNQIKEHSQLSKKPWWKFW